MTRNCVNLGIFTKGAYNIEWMESVSLHRLYAAIGQMSEMISEGNNA